MEEYGFFIDLETCIGCGSCQLACSEYKGLGVDRWFRRVLRVEKKTFIGAFSMGCNHCRNPACVLACPNGAMYRDENRGVVLHNVYQCIGCGACTWACPYGAVSISFATGRAQKCNSCIELREKDKEPACTAACPVKSLRFGRIRDFEQEGGENLSMDFLPDAGLTKPSTRIRKRRGADIEKS